MEHIYDLIIIGSGPAGLSAAIYAKRARLDTLIIEKEGMSGGQMLTTYEVDNYPGLVGIGGLELGMKMREHADKLEADFVDAEVLEVKEEGTRKRIIADNAVYLTRTVILAMGAGHAKLQIPGEEKFTGMGVSYCATCDGAFFRDKEVAVIGGGDVAVEDAIFLGRICKKVYLIHRRDELRAAKILQDNLFAMNNVEILWNTIPLNIEGEGQVESLHIQDKEKVEERKLMVQGVFVAVGIRPNTETLSLPTALDPSGYIVADEGGETNIPGIFAAGDIRTKRLRQIITAAADGANCITSVQDYLIKIQNMI